MRFVSPEPNTGCWLWTGGLFGGTGYANIGVGGKSRGAHRVLYELHRGPIPTGMQLDHLCRQRSCVNPAHLEVVTNRENGRRGNSPPAIVARTNHCKRGHEFTAANTRPTKHGRSCRACESFRSKQRHANPEIRSAAREKRRARRLLRAEVIS